MTILCEHLQAGNCGVASQLADLDIPTTESMCGHGFVIGVPVWDSWIVWHMLIHRFKIKAKLTPGLLHLNHPMGWSDTDLAKGLAIMQREHGIGQRGLSVAVSDVTGRLHVKPGRHRTPPNSYT